MAKNNKCIGNILLCTFILLCFVPLCESIICYTCHSEQEPACGDNFQILTSDLSSRWECAGSCFKRRGKRSNGEVRRTEVQRGCILAQKEHCFTEYFNGMNQYTCTCNTNFCNTAPVSLPSKYWLWLCGLLLQFILRL